MVRHGPTWSFYHFILLVWAFFWFIRPRTFPFYLLQVNTLSLRRSRPFKDEEKAYNKTLEFIDELPSKLDGTKPSILISHTTLKRISNKATITKVSHVYMYFYIIRYRKCSWLWWYFLLWTCQNALAKQSSYNLRQNSWDSSIYFLI